MAKRKQIGLVYSYNENWIAGAYYILNIIHALNVLPNRLKPEITLLTESKELFKKVKSETKYPFLKSRILPFKAEYFWWERLVNKISLRLFNKKIINKKTQLPKIEFLYPNQMNAFLKHLKRVNWVPDFQEEHLPQFFAEEEIKNRKAYQKQILAKSDVVVFSSEDSKNDFLNLYPESQSKLFVLPFAVTLPDTTSLNINDLLKKYNLPEKYFFLPNQFWAHKNHIVLLKAVKKLKDRGVEVVVAFSGKEFDYRNVDNFNKLKSYIKDNSIEANIKFLGFMDRKEQLCLMQHAIAIIQPSLFEGWSTVVEDAKALNKFIILSDLKVHKEQINKNVCFFNPNDEVKLSQILEQNLIVKPKIIKINYDKDIYNFGLKFIDLINISSKN